MDDFSFVNNVEALAKDIPTNVLKERAANISKEYSKNDNNRSNLVCTEIDALTYAIMRMPATVSVISRCLDELLKYDKNILNILDVGSGTGASYFALSKVLSSFHLTCLEKQLAMIKMMNQLIKDERVISIKDDVSNFTTDEKYDLVICAYSFNELDRNTKNIILKKLIGLTNKYLLIIEPGTPYYYQNLINIKNDLASSYKMNILAPCMCNFGCHLNGTDYCNFTTRINRSKLHKELKGGDAAFEDEKYFYLIGSKQSFNPLGAARLIRHPRLNKNNVDLKLCFNDKISEIKIFKNDKRYKSSKKLRQGDIVNL